MLKIYEEGTGELAIWMEHLIINCEDQGLDAQNTWKSSSRKSETRDFWGRVQVQWKSLSQ